MLTLRSRAYVWPTVLFLGAGFALANGLGYAHGNLRQYLLHPLHSLDPSFLASDWFTTQTRPHHAAFNALVIEIGRIMPLDAVFAAANGVFAVGFVICIYLLAARFYRAPIVAAAMAVLIWATNPTSLIGLSSIINSYFQPSTIGAVGLLAGLTALLYGRYSVACLALFLAALFHINYMVWIALIVLAVIAVDLRRIGPRQAAILLGPVVLAAAFHAPFILQAQVPEQADCSEPAARILHDIYMPCHSRPLTWGLEPFLRFAAIIAAGAVGLRAVRVDRPPDRMTWAILGALAAIVAGGLLLTTAVRVDLVALLFPFRLAPLLALASQVAVAGAIATTAQFPVLSPTRTLLLWAALGLLLYWGGASVYGLICLGVLSAALFADRLAQEPDCRGATALGLLGVLSGLLYLCGAGAGAMAVVLAVVLGAAAWRYLDRRRMTRRPWARATLFAGAAAPLLVGAMLMRIGATRKDFMGPPSPAGEQALYDWCGAHTKPDDVFVIPPLLGQFRLGARRAVVIDWKCMPILPKDTVEWYRRLQDECGPFSSLTEAENGYLAVDENVAGRLARGYGAKYLVVEAGRHQGRVAGLSRVYANQDFAVFELPDARQAAATESP